MLRPLMVLLSGGLFRHVLTIAALPLLARLYEPDAFGRLGAVMAIVSLTAVVVHGRYHLAIPGARDHAEARALSRLAFGGVLVLSLPAVALAWSFFADPIDRWLTLGCATVLTASVATIDVSNYWRSRMRRFAVSARLDGARAAFVLVAQFLLVPFGTLGLLLGTLGGTALVAALGFLDMLRTMPRAYPAAGLSAVARRYRAHPLFGVPQGWVAALSHNLMPLLLLKFAGVALVGQYWVAYRLMLAPVALLNGAYRQAALGRLADAAPHAAAEAVRTHTSVLLALGAVPCAALFVYGEPLLVALLGHGWSTAGSITAWLALGFWADGFKIPTFAFLQATGRQRSILLWEIAVVTVRYAFALPLMLSGRPLDAIAVYSCAGLLGWSLFCLCHLRSERRFVLA